MNTAGTLMAIGMWVAGFAIMWIAKVIIDAIEKKQIEKETR